MREALPALERRYDHAALYSPSFTLPPHARPRTPQAIIEAFAR